MVKKVGIIVPCSVAGAIMVNSLAACGKVMNETYKVISDEKVSRKNDESENQEESEYQKLINYTDKNSLEYINELNNYVNSFEFDKEEISAELENIAVAGTVGLSDFEYYNETLFKDLSTTVEDGTSVVDFYYPLAKFNHLEKCTLSHDISETGVIDCKSLTSKLDELNETVLMHGYFIENIKDTDDKELTKELNKILNSSCDIEECLNELENVYYYSSVPTDLDLDTWNSLFGELQKTVGERINPCDYYYELAFNLHSLNCEENHSLNEFGKHECDEVKTRTLHK